MNHQADISAMKLKARLGQELTVLIDAVHKGRATGRSYADAPEIDGVVHIAQGQGLKPGDFVKVRVTRSDDYDLWGRPV